jgi:conjugal transfer pilus assembly protein TraV
MVKKGIKFLAIFLVVLGFSGCASKLMNPYSEEYSCPQAEKGKCVSIKQAYLESLQNQPPDLLFSPSPQVNSLFSSPFFSTPQVNSQPANATSFSAQSVFPQETLVESYGRYNEALIKKLQQMLENPKTPVLAPPQVIRVLILPYAADKNTFYADRYVYVIVEDPQWVFHNILNVQEENK